MIEKIELRFKLLVLLFFSCIFHVSMVYAQTTIPLRQFQDSILAAQNSITSTGKFIRKLSHQDSLLNFKHVKIRTIVIAEARYYGLNYETNNIPKWTTSYQISNKINLGGIPFNLNGFLGNNIAIPGRGVSRFQLNFDANAFAKELALRYIQKEQERLSNQLLNDSNFIKYKEAAKMATTYSDLLNEDAYKKELENKQVLVSQYESIGDTALLKKQIYKDAKGNVDLYNKRLNELDSIKQYLSYIEKLNPLWKSFSDSAVSIKSKSSHLGQTDLENQIRNNKSIPTPLRWLSQIQKFEIGMVFPDFHPLLFKGAPIKGMLISTKNKWTFFDAVYGKVFSPGDFFRDTLISSKVYALSTRAGISYKSLKISYTILQSNRINSTDTFAFRYYFESPKTALVQGVSATWEGKSQSFFIHTSKSELVGSSNSNQSESTRVNDINKNLLGSSTPFNETAALQIGCKFKLSKTKTELTLKYNYQGKYYFSPLRVFTLPPGHQYEAMLNQSFLKKQVQFKVGIVSQKSNSKGGYFTYTDQTYSYNFQLNLRIKKLPIVTITYLPYYRTSIYQGEDIIMKMEQLTATSVYNYQAKNNFISLIGSYARNKVENIYSGIYEQGGLYASYKNLGTPIGYNISGLYFSKPMVSKDSAITYDIKASIEYQFKESLSLQVGGGYAISKERNRYYPYVNLIWDNRYVGVFKLKADYTWLTEYGIYKQGMSIICSITRTIF